jgi:hypothetical protein
VASIEGREEAERNEQERRVEELQEELDRLKQDLALAEIKCTDLEQTLNNKGTGDLIMQTDVRPP